MLLHHPKPSQYNQIQIKISSSSNPNLISQQQSFNIRNDQIKLTPQQITQQQSQQNKQLSQNKFQNTKNISFANKTIIAKNKNQNQNQFQKIPKKIKINYSKTKRNKFTQDSPQRQKIYLRNRAPTVNLARYGKSPTKGRDNVKKEIKPHEFPLILRDNIKQLKPEEKPSESDPELDDINLQFLDEHFNESYYQRYSITELKKMLGKPFSFCYQREKKLQLEAQKLLKEKLYKEKQLLQQQQNCSNNKKFAHQNSLNVAENLFLQNKNKPRSSQLILDQSQNSQLSHQQLNSNNTNQNNNLIEPSIKSFQSSLNINELDIQKKNYKNIQQIIEKVLIDKCIKNHEQILQHKHQEQKEKQAQKQLELKRKVTQVFQNEQKKDTLYKTYLKQASQKYNNNNLKIKKYPKNKISRSQTYNNFYPSKDKQKKQQQQEQESKQENKQQINIQYEQNTQQEQNQNQKIVQQKRQSFCHDLPSSSTRKKEDFTLLNFNNNINISKSLDKDTKKRVMERLNQNFYKQAKKNNIHTPNIYNKKPKTPQQIQKIMTNISQKCKSQTRNFYHMIHQKKHSIKQNIILNKTFSSHLDHKVYPQNNNINASLNNINNNNNDDDDYYYYNNNYIDYQSNQDSQTDFYDFTPKSQNILQQIQQDTSVQILKYNNDYLIENEKQIKQQPDQKIMRKFSEFSFQDVTQQQQKNSNDENQQVKDSTSDISISTNPEQNYYPDEYYDKLKQIRQNSKKALQNELNPLPYLLRTHSELVQHTYQNGSQPYKTMLDIYDTNIKQKLSTKKSQKKQQRAKTHHHPHRSSLLQQQQQEEEQLQSPLIKSNQKQLYNNICNDQDFSSQMNDILNQSHILQKQISLSNDQYQRCKLKQLKSFSTSSNSFLTPKPSQKYTVTDYFSHLKKQKQQQQLYQQSLENNFLKQNKDHILFNN